MNNREVMQQALEALEAVYGDSCDAIHALRAALAEPEPRNQCGETCERAKLCAVCASALAEPQEPRSDYRDWDYQNTLDALAEPQEPMCDCCANCLRPKHEHRGDDCPKPYTTVWHAWDYTSPAPQRQPLTDEQIRELSQQHKFDSRMEKFVRIIERAHGIGGKE